MSDEKFDRFVSAFSSNVAGSVRTCACGRTYYNSNGGWDWEDGELEALEDKFPENDRDYSIGVVRLGGQHYANACDCWHEKAKKAMQWVDYHARDVATYLNGERENALSVAKGMPQVTDHGG